MTIFLPLLLMLLIIIGIVAINGRTSKKPITYQKTKWIFIGYIVILVIGVILSPLLPVTEAKQPEMNYFESEWDNAAQNKYLELLEEGFSELYQDKVNNTWNFSYTSDSLIIESVHYDGGILIERTSELQNKIEAFFIKDYAVMGVGSVLVDIGEYQPDMTVDLHDDVLLVQGPANEPQINLALTELEFTITQFNQNKIENGYSYTGSHFFYIRIPQELNISYSEYVYVDFVKN